MYETEFALRRPDEEFIVDDADTGSPSTICNVVDALRERLRAAKSANEKVTETSNDGDLILLNRNVEVHERLGRERSADV